MKRGYLVGCLLSFQLRALLLLMLEARNHGDLVSPSA